MRKKLLKIFLIMFIFLLANSASANIYTHIKVRIFSPTYLEVPMILTGVDAARMWFYKRTGKTQNDREVFVVVSKEDNKTIFGYFDKRFIFVRPHDKKFVVFGQEVDRMLYALLVMHEAAHYLLYYHTDGYWDTPAYEYLAWVMFFEMLPTKYLHKILKDYEEKFTPFDDRTGINLNFLELSTEVFAIKSYAYHLKDKGKLLKEILNGEFKSFRLRRFYIPPRQEKDFILPQPDLTKIN